MVLTLNIVNSIGYGNVINQDSARSGFVLLKLNKFKLAEPVIIK